VKFGSERISLQIGVGLKLMDSSRATADSKLVVQQAEVYQGVMDAYAYGLIETDV